MSAPPEESPQPSRPARRAGPLPAVVPAAVGFAAGVGAAEFVPGMALPVAVVIGLAAILVATWGRDAWRRRCATVSLAAFGAGLAAGTLDLAETSAGFSDQEARLVRLEGVVVGRTETYVKRRPFALDEEVRGRMTVRAGGVDVRLLARGPFSGVGPGDRIRAVGWRLPPRAVTNPGQRQWANEMPAVAVGDPANVTVLKAASRWSLTRLRSSLGDRLSGQFATHLSREHAALADALLLGRRDGLSGDLRGRLIGIGAVHLISISGLHLGLLAVFVRRCVRVAGVGPAAQAWLPAVVVVAYAGLIDGRPPATRAAVAVCVWAGLQLLGRATSVPATLAVAAIAVLLGDPTAVGDVGAQLSFLAILGVTLPGRAGAWDRGDYIEEASGSWTEFLTDRTRKLLAASCGSFAVTTPLVAARIGLAAPAGPLAGSVLLLPVAAMLVVGFAWAGAAVVGLSGIGPIGGVLGGLFSTAAATFDLTLAALHPLAGPTVAVLSVGAGWTAAAVTIGFAAYRFAPSLGPWRSGAVLVVGLGVAAVPHLWSSPPTGLRVTFLDVGHGGATLVETPDGRAVLFDCGSLGNGARAARVVGDALRARGLTGLDAVVLSHPDADHDNGLTTLLETRRVASVITTRRFLHSEEPVSVETREAVAAAGVPMTFAVAGDRLALGGGVTAAVLAPDPDEATEERADNETSLVLAVGYAGRTVVLTGDIEGEPLDAMLDRVGPLGVDLIAAPHHGSPNVMTGRLLSAWSPDRVIVAAGSRRDRAAVEAAYRGAKVLWTGDGTVTATIGADGSIAVARGP